jgi:hypothetical protein
MTSDAILAHRTENRRPAMTRTPISNTDRFRTYREMISRRQDRPDWRTFIRSDDTMARYGEAVRHANQAHRTQQCTCTREVPCDAWCADWARALDTAYERLGREAHDAKRPVTPTAHPQIQEAIRDLPVGITDITAAFERGWIAARKQRQFL